jgi:hypothetical protein
MPGLQAAAKFIKRKVIILFERRTDEQTGLVVECRFPTAGVRQGIGRASLTVAAEEVLDGGEADAEQVSNFGQGVFAAFISFDDAAAEIIRVWVHSSHANHSKAKCN